MRMFSTTVTTTIINRTAETSMGMHFIDQAIYTQDSVLKGSNWHSRIMGEEDFNSLTGL